MENKPSGSKKNIDGEGGKREYKSYVEQLLSKPLPAGAEITTYDKNIAAAGYIDETFLYQPGDEYYVEGGGFSQNPYPISEEEAEALILHGAKDCRVDPFDLKYGDMEYDPKTKRTR